MEKKISHMDNQLPSLRGKGEQSEIKAKGRELAMDPRGCNL